MLLQDQVHLKHQCWSNVFAMDAQGLPQSAAATDTLPFTRTIYSPMAPLLHNKRLITAAATSVDDVAAAAHTTRQGLHSQPCIAALPVHTPFPPQTCCDKSCKLDNVSNTTVPLWCTGLWSWAPKLHQTHASQRQWHPNSKLTTLFLATQQLQQHRLPASTFAPRIFPS